MERFVQVISWVSILWKLLGMNDNCEQGQSQIGLRGSDESFDGKLHCLYMVNFVFFSFDIYIIDC